MQVSPQLASPRRLHRRQAAVLAAPCPRALRYPHAEGRRDFPGKAAQSQRSMGYRLLSLYGGRARGKAMWKPQRREAQTGARLFSPRPHRTPVLIQLLLYTMPFPTHAGAEGKMQSSPIVCWEKPVGASPHRSWVHRQASPLTCPRRNGVC